MVKPPFFIEWEEGRSAQSEIRASFPKQFKIHKIIIDSEKRSKTLSKWKKWFDVTILEEGDNYTDVQLTVDHIIYRIQDGKTSGYNTIIFKDTETTAPYSIITKGAKYRFEPEG